MATPSRLRGPSDHDDGHASIQDLFEFEKDQDESLDLAARAGLVPENDPNDPQLRGPRRRQFLFAMLDGQVNESKVRTRKHR